MGKIEQNKERKRHAILDAASEIFLSDGYVAANMDRIAAFAGVTKQTVYRYFASKMNLFQATLMHIRKDGGEDFSRYLDLPDERDTLSRFAVAFMRAHLSQEHLRTYRLLVSESATAPEMAQVFRTVGPDNTASRLTRFFADRLAMGDPETAVRLWTAMLLAFRNTVPVGGPAPTEQEIADHAHAATDLLLRGAKDAPD
ncbi:TetR/AcrR family transcriptional regulator [Breoghania sp.]|uniref:TetR/AcrR family transcriptional regulator n=1 Tax=Breoghania sp. TaxID=2065378 RepID=UPI00263195E3|nr:TetR/AcrR family transcriptional regulator [Breoghania sp.]MDJ0930273.1 TetR/AcrR family transcriptional regulator [Breoghania sp.]